MGVYLSEPETKKSISEGSKGEVRYVSGEMQGSDAFIFRLEEKHGGCSDSRTQHRRWKLALRCLRWPRRYHSYHLGP